jgi:hypothetical protein
MDGNYEGGTEHKNMLQVNERLIHDALIGIMNILKWKL